MPNSLQSRQGRINKREVYALKLINSRASTAPIDNSIPCIEKIFPRREGEPSAIYEQVLQLQGVLGREAGFVVVEVAEDFPALAAPGGDDLGPGRQGPVVVPALVGSAGAVEADIDKIRGDLLGGQIPV